MVTEAYKAYLKSKQWQMKRTAVFAIHGKRCKACKSVKPPIHVHHLDYTRLYREDPKRDLLPLCKDCHVELTRIYKRNRRRGLRRVTWEYIYSKQRATRPNRTGR